jgi:hypothetical protein
MFRQPAALSSKPTTLIPPDLKKESLMATDQIDPAFLEPALLEPGAAPAQPDLLVSAVLHLMSHYTANSNVSGDTRNCVKLACVIERHLKALSDLPGLAPVLRATCQQLSEQWAAVVDRALPPPQKPNMFVRLASGARTA